MHKLAAYIVQGPMQSATVAVIFALAVFIPFVGILLVVVSAAAISLLTLVNGPNQGFNALGIAAMLVGIVGYILTNHIGLAIVLLLLLWIPNWMFAYLLRRRHHLSMTVFSASALAIGIIAGLFLFSNPVLDWENFYKESLLPALTQQAGKEVENTWLLVALQDGRLVIGNLAAIIWALNISGLLLARHWQSVLYKPGAFTDEFIRLRFGSLVAWGGIVMAVAGMWLPEGKWADLALTSLIVLGMLFIFQGLSLVKFWAKQHNIPNGVLTLIYIVVFITPLQLLLGIIGWSDNWIHFRRKLAKS